MNVIDLMDQGEFDILFVLYECAWKVDLGKRMAKALHETTDDEKPMDDSTAM